MPPAMNASDPKQPPADSPASQPETAPQQEDTSKAQPSPQTQPESKPARDDLDYVSDTKAAFLENRSPYASLLLFVLVGIVSAFVYWASASRIDEITRGQGKVVPTTFLQVVQSLEGGIVSEIAAREGERVSKGQVLLRIDESAFTSALNESAAQRDNLMATIARLEAEADDRDAIDFPADLLERRPDLARSETRLFASRRDTLLSGEAHLSQSLALKRQELEITIPLAERGIVSQVELLRLQSAVNDTESELRRLRSDYQKEVLSKASEARAKLEQVAQSVGAYEDKIRRATLLSPVNGIINKVHFNTIGGVIRPGEPIVEIVPLDGDLVVEANVNPADIGFIHPGQEATVKLTAYDFSIYGGLKGVVEQISADTFTNERGESFYKIRVRTGERSLQTGGETLEILPGMQAQVDILTGEKSVLDYIFKPLLRAKMNALTER